MTSSPYCDWGREVSLRYSTATRVSPTDSLVSGFISSDAFTNAILCSLRLLRFKVLCDSDGLL